MGEERIEYQAIELPEEQEPQPVDVDALPDSEVLLMLQGPDSTVVAECEPYVRNEKGYQTEAQLEEEFIAQLKKQAYEHVDIHDEDALIRNLRTQLERLNSITFSDTEWDRFFRTKIASDNDGVLEKTKKIQQDSIQILDRDDGTHKNIKLIDKANIHNNHLQVLNQYEAAGARKTRYDVTILVNGLPLVHVELKRRGVNIKEAFNQIKRYDRDSFWSGSGLFEYVQLFVISNGTLTKYYSNTTRKRHVDEAKGSQSHKRTSNSFEFTSYWADARNRPIYDLVPFTKTFFAKHALLNILTRYCVFTEEQALLAMRPYQIVATERILNRILISENDKRLLGTAKAGGFIWHTTGSGKTLTSFKTAQLASDMDGVDKVLFVVDRKDLDYQTMKEYDRFEKGAVNGNTSTAKLAKQLADPNSRIIVTTIQKLSTFIAKNSKHDVYDKHVVPIFDECHRSQFGDMHKAITKSFKNYHLFGFTGTPIFADNAGTSKDINLRTTAQAFGDKLHTYTIVDAIRDENVLPFRIDYLETVKQREDIQEQFVRAIDRERIYLAPERIAKNVEYTLEHFPQKTKRMRGYEISRLKNIKDVARASEKNNVEEQKRHERIMGFNSIFTTASIPAAKAYYSEFKKQIAARPGDKIKVALIYSFAPNEEETDIFAADEDMDPSKLDLSSRDFLEEAIDDYNKMFGTSYDTSAEEFESYYKDVSLRMKNRELDMLIVVNMFLTGFDATTLNTLWVDKDLRMHGLIQAFSRTNRILNSVKTFGNIVCFRNLEDRVNEAIGLFGDKEAQGMVVLKPYRDYLAEYETQIGELRELVMPGDMPFGEEAERQFIILMGKILRLQNILTSFDDFAEDDVLGSQAMQNYLGVYETLREKYQ